MVLLSWRSPRIGKSRLTVALLESLAVPNRTTRLRYFCSPQHTERALYPIINQMEPGRRVFARRRHPEGETR